MRFRRLGLKSVPAAGREQRIVGGVPYPALKDFFDRTLQ